VECGAFQRCRGLPLLAGRGDRATKYPCAKKISLFFDSILDIYYYYYYYIYAVFVVYFQKTKSGGGR
jgi:hypothetical protein